MVKQRIIKTSKNRENKGGETMTQKLREKSALINVQVEITKQLVMLVHIKQDPV